MKVEARRPMGVLLLTSLLASATSCGPARSTDELRGFDVVLIVIDTLRADHLPFYGYDVDTAPFLSRLASQGAVFRRAHSPSSKTSPATASIFTSLYPFQHQVLTGFVASWHWEIELNRIPDEVETIAEVFKRGGYTTF
jgi:arylsulfatase A-like enzyme